MLLCPCSPTRGRPDPAVPLPLIPSNQSQLNLITANTFDIWKWLASVFPCTRSKFVAAVPLPSTLPPTCSRYCNIYTYNKATGPLHITGGLHALLCISSHIFSREIRKKKKLRHWYMKPNGSGGWLFPFVFCVVFFFVVVVVFLPIISAARPRPGVSSLRVTAVQTSSSC